MNVKKNVTLVNVINNGKIKSIIEFMADTKWMHAWKKSSRLKKKQILNCCKIKYEKYY